MKAKTIFLLVTLILILLLVNILPTTFNLNTEYNKYLIAYQIRFALQQIERPIIGGLIPIPIIKDKIYEDTKTNFNLNQNSNENIKFSDSIRVYKNGKLIE